MKLNRRNVLVGLGTIVAGGGAALGTSAFSSVEADRTIDISVANDDSAFLALDATDNSGLVTNSGGAGNELEFNLEKLNDNATTKVEPAFTITNNGGQDVGVHVQAMNDTDNTTVEAFNFTSQSEQSEGDDLTNSPGEDEDGNLAAGDPGESVTVNMVITSDDTHTPTGADTVEIIADEEDYSVSSS